MEIILIYGIWTLACLMVVSLARTRKIGVIRALNISLLFSPIVGLIAVLLSNKMAK